jgi:hypothetical protein
LIEKRIELYVEYGTFVHVKHRIYGATDATDRRVEIIAVEIEVQ